jgi:hypothetical protein
MMKRLFRTLLALSAASFALCLASPAQAQCRGVWTKMCPTPPPSEGRDEVYVPPYDPVAEKLRADIQTYESAMNVIYEASASIEPFLGLPMPANEQELSRRVDSVLATLWPEFSANALEADLMRRQASFFDGRNGELRNTLTWQRDRIFTLRNDIPARTQQIAAAEARLPQVRQREAEVTALALAQLNDRTSERRAIASLLAFAQQPVASPDWLVDGPRITVVPGTKPLPGAPLQSAPLAPSWAEPREPTGYATLTVSQPAPGAALTEKFAVMQVVGTNLQRDANDVRFLRDGLPNRRAENASLRAQVAALGSELRGVDDQMRQLNQRFGAVNGQIDASLANSLGANAVIAREVLADIALDRLSGEMRAIVDFVAGSEGLEARVPANSTQALLDFARRGGRVLLPVQNYAAQWEAFVDVQEKTLDVLARAEGFMTEAAQVAARGSPAEMEAVFERVFASVRWQTLDYIKTTGFSALPDGEDKSTLEDALERYADKRRERESGE